jgi:CelD/BcsL family acetyltransferase involved in cellulose biosynthesis
LQALGEVKRHRAETPAERREAYEALIAQKRARMTALALPNEFDDPAVAAFIGRLSDLDGAGTGFEWHVARAGERIVSVYGGFERQGRLSGLVFSHDVSPDVAPASPGEFMVLSLAEHAFARGLEMLDYGVGEARYKTESCEIVEDLFDTAFAANVMGLAGAAAFRLARRVKRHVKQTPRLFDAARAVQRMMARGTR